MRNSLFNGRESAPSRTDEETASLAAVSRALNCCDTFPDGSKFADKRCGGRLSSGCALGKIGVKF